MKAETKKKIQKTLTNDTDIFKEYQKTEIGKKSIVIPIVGFIVLLLSSGILGFIIGDTIGIMENECPNHETTHLGWLFIIFCLTWISGILIGMYFGQARQYHLTNKKTK